MSQTPNTAIAVIGIDIGKNSFHVVGLDDRGAIEVRVGRQADIQSCLNNRRTILSAFESKQRP